MGQMVLVCYPEVDLQLQSLHKPEISSLTFFTSLCLAAFDLFFLPVSKQAGNMRFFTLVPQTNLLMCALQSPFFSSLLNKLH